jgi:RNA polymerase sigma factor (sigma-70 family)
MVALGSTSMKGTSGGDVPDLMATGDEQLIVLFRGGKCPEAREELILRYLRWTRHAATMQARKARLAPDFLEDGRQIGNMALLEAIDKYDTEQVLSAGGCSFRTFLGHVFRNRYLDFLKKTRRAERRYDRSFAAALAIEEGRNLARTSFDRDCFSVSEIGDPALLVERREERARLEDAINALSTSKHVIWIRLCAGAKLKTIAKDLGISYDATRRRLGKTLNLLRRQVEGRENS